MCIICPGELLRLKRAKLLIGWLKRSMQKQRESITSVSPSFGKGAGIRIFKDKKDGFVSTNDLTKNGLMRSVSQAIEMLDISEKKNKELFRGLNELKDYSASKKTWIKEIPTINEISEKLILSTNSLNKNKIKHCFQI